MGENIGQIVDSTSLNSENIRNGTSVENLAFLIKHIACTTCGHRSQKSRSKNCDCDCILCDFRYAKCAENDLKKEGSLPRAEEGATQAAQRAAQITK